MIESVTIAGRLGLVSLIAVMVWHVPLRAMAHSAFFARGGCEYGAGAVTIAAAAEPMVIVGLESLAKDGEGPDKPTGAVLDHAAQTLEEERGDSSDGEYASAVGSDGELDGVAALMRSVSIAHPMDELPGEVEPASARLEPARRFVAAVGSFGHKFTAQRPLIVILCRIWKVMPDRLCQEGIDILVAALDQPFTADKVDQQKLRAAISAFLDKWFGRPTSLGSGERGGMNNHKWRTELADALIQAEVGREIAEALSREFDQEASLISIERLHRATEAAEVFRSGGEGSGSNSF